MTDGSGAGQTVGVLPAGRVTFVFTDVEESTKHFVALGPRYAPTLATQHEILRRHIESYRGAVVRTDGDGVFAAFPDATDAVRACVAAQRELAGLQWASGDALRVRMGMHTGDAEPINGDYVALAVHLAARVGASGHGGQILVSETTAGDVETPEGVELQELGRYRLRGFDDPVAIHQVCAPDLPIEFPKLKVLSVQAHNVPVARTSFVGRDLEIARVVKLLETTRLFTVTGTGGAGKSRLAAAVAAATAETFTAGAWMVELGAVTDGDAAVDAVASALGVRPGPDRRARLLEHVRDQSLLLVLDGCEHIVDDIALLVDELLSAGIDVHVLATSREPLRISGEQTWKLPSLDVPPEGATTLNELLDYDSARLLVDRVTLADPDIVFDTDTASAIGRICRRLDGLPLAIELAAARVRAQTLPEIADALDDAFSVLTDGMRTALPQHRTMEAAVTWSYDRLDDEEQRVFRSLAQFVGTFSRAAVRGVAADDATDRDVERPLDALVERSLVERVSDDAADEERFR